jgi:hypothetical protein
VTAATASSQRGIVVVAGAQETQRQTRRHPGQNPPLPPLRKSSPSASANPISNAPSAAAAAAAADAAPAVPPIPNRTQTRTPTPTRRRNCPSRLVRNPNRIEVLLPIVKKKRMVQPGREDTGRRRGSSRGTSDLRRRRELRRIRMRTSRRAGRMMMRIRQSRIRNSCRQTQTQRMRLRRTQSQKWPLQTTKHTETRRNPQKSWQCDRYLRGRRKRGARWSV